MLEKFIISSDEEKVGNQNSWCKASNFSGSKIQGAQTLSDKSNIDIMIGKIGQISKVEVFS